MRKHIIITILVVLSVSPAGYCREGSDGNVAATADPGTARVALSTNAADYIYLLTPNADVQVAVGRRFTVQAGLKYNRWSWGYGTDKEMKNRQQTYFLGARWWPWYTYSGWYVGLAAQWQEYDRGGLLRKDSESGRAYGLSVSGGYALQVTRWFNIDFGIGVWGGSKTYTLYACPYCGRKIEEGRKFFFLPNEARIAAQFIF